MRRWLPALGLVMAVSSGGAHATSCTQISTGAIERWACTGGGASTFTLPNEWNPLNNSIEAIGGGGGGTCDLNGPWGGAGGGYQKHTNFPCTGINGNNVIPITVGSGGAGATPVACGNNGPSNGGDGGSTIWNSAATVLATGGFGGRFDGTGSIGGCKPPTGPGVCVGNSTSHNGGNGAGNISAYSSAGGGAAGPFGDGGAAGGHAPGGGPGGGAGGNGGGGNGVSGGTDGGAGGAAEDGSAGGAGGTATVAASVGTNGSGPGSGGRATVLGAYTAGLNGSNGDDFASGLYGSGSGAGAPATDGLGTQNGLPGGAGGRYGGGGASGGFGANTRGNGGPGSDGILFITNVTSQSSFCVAPLPGALVAPQVEVNE